MQTDQRPKQLQMTWPGHGSISPPTFSIPPEYTLRTFQPGDEEGYLHLMHLAEFSYWTQQNVQESLLRAVPRGLFLIVHNPTDCLVATTSAQHSSYHQGEIGWVAGDPTHRGKKLGFAVCAAALQRLVEIGYREITLKTDDFRLPAVKIYFELGFIPCLTSDDMNQRWQKVCQQLGMDLNALKGESS
jgi:mycothiol synthase